MAHAVTAAAPPALGLASSLAPTQSDARNSNTKAPAPIRALVKEHSLR